MIEQQPIFPVKVYDGNGKLKKVINQEQLKKQHWKNYAKETENRKKGVGIYAELRDEVKDTFYIPRIRE